MLYLILKKKFINTSVASALNQTYSNLEIIIVYDDEDKSDLEYLIKTYNSTKKIFIVVNEKNMGAGRSRNIGIKKAKENILVFRCGWFLGEK